MGKTTLLCRLCRRTAMAYVHAADLVRAGDPGSLIPDGERVAVDGLDGTASPGTGSAVEAVLRRLKRCADAGLSAGRIAVLFEAGGGVPTALRGMHAWIARLSPALAGRCIAADPHAMLHDGETETLDLERASCRAEGAPG